MWVDDFVVFLGSRRVRLRGVGDMASSPADFRGVPWHELSVTPEGWTSLESDSDSCLMFAGT